MASGLKTIFRSKILQTILAGIPSHLSMIVISIIVAQLVGDTGKGIIGIVSLNVEVFVLALSLSITSSMAYFYYQKKLSFGQLLSIAFGVFGFALAIVSIIFLLCYYVFEYNIVLHDSQFDSTYLLIYFFVSFCSNFVSSYTVGLIQTKQNINYLNRASLINSFVFSAMIIAVYFYARSMEPMEALWIVVPCLTLISGLRGVVPLLFLLRLCYTHKYRLEKVNLLTEVWPFIRYSLFGHLSNVLNYFNYKIDQWILVLFVSATYQNMGDYLQAVSIAQMIWIIPTSINLIAHPKICEDPKFSLSIEYLQLNNTMVYICSFLALVLGPLVIPAVYGSAFEESVLPMQILLIGMIFSSYTRFVASYNIANGNVKYNFYGTLAGLLFTIVFDLLLIPKFGIIGAAWATNTTYFAVFVVSAYFAVRFHASRFNSNWSGEVWSLFLPTFKFDLIRK